MGLKDWLEGLLRIERPDRYPGTGLLAYFWDGSLPVGHAVKDISLTGAYIYAKERWYVGTILEIALREVRFPTAKDAGEALTCSVRCKVIRHGADGMGVAFLLHSPEEKQSLTRIVNVAKEPAAAWEPVRVILPHAE